MSSDTGGKATSAVPVGTSGTSSVVPGEPCGTATPWVVATCAGAWMTPIVAGVDEEVGDVGSRSSSDRENPYATRIAATATPIVTAIRVVRDLRFGSGSIVSTTAPTLSR
jgi:hypothetical protein